MLSLRFLLSVILLIPLLSQRGDAFFFAGGWAGQVPPVPAQATAQGFTTLAFNGDMTQSFDISCVNPATSDHQWYLGANRTMASSCGNGAIVWPHTDETDGSTVLQLSWTPSNQHDPGILGRQGIATADFFGAHQTSFPINAYYECVMRYSSYTLSHMAMWSNCWMVNASPAIINGSSSPTLEYDLTEFHGGYFNNQELGGTINWNCRATCYGMAWFGNPNTIIPGYDPSQFHKYGWLLYQTSAHNLHGKAYIDDILFSEGDIQLDDSQPDPDLAETKQRNFIIIDLTSGCNFDEGSTYCMNVSSGPDAFHLDVQNVYADGSGNTRITNGNTYVWSNSFLLNISGVLGVTSPINGNWIVDCGGGCTDFGIRDPISGNPVPLVGTYTPGTGVLNNWNDTTLADRAYIKSFRVWSCPTWATTQCSAFNPN